MLRRAAILLQWAARVLLLVSMVFVPLVAFGDYLYWHTSPLGRDHGFVTYRECLVDNWTAWRTMVRWP